MIEVDRQIGAASAQDGDQRHHQLQRSRQRYGDDRLGSDAPLAQVQRQRQTAAIEFGVIPCFRPERHRRPIGKGAHRIFDQGGKADVRHRVSRGIIGLKLPPGFLWRSGLHRGQRVGPDGVRQENGQPLAMGSHFLLRVEVGVRVDFQSQTLDRIAAKGEVYILHRTSAGHMQRRVEPVKAWRTVIGLNIDERSI